MEGGAPGPFHWLPEETFWGVTQPVAAAAAPITAECFNKSRRFMEFKDSA
jgi:hypothetical protein